MSIYLEPARELPIADKCDVIVCGGGPAGVAAAITAARAGANTRLFDVHGCLGGVWTAGALSYVLDCGNKQGLIWEIVQRLERYAGNPVNTYQTVNYPWVQRSFFYDVELMKLTLDELCLEAGVTVQLHTRVVAAARDVNNRLTTVITESKSGRQAWQARVFVDATGDGDLAALAGCRFDYGEEGSGRTQPMSLIALVTGIRAEDVHNFIGGRGGVKGWPQDNLFQEMQRAGVEPSYHRPALFHIREDLFALMANHEYGVSGLNAAQITQATFRARAEVHRLVNALRALGGPWQHLRIVSTAAQIGVRESRRIYGRYRITRADLEVGTKHADAVCTVTMPVDLHSPNPAVNKSYTTAGVKSKPFDIPLRALIAQDVDGLLMAGRCISGDFLAHSSYRVTGNAVAMGEVAGATAALAAQTGCLPHEVAFEEVRATLDQTRAFTLEFGTLCAGSDYKRESPVIG